MPLRRPLSPSILHILLALAEGPRHGYAIKLDVETRSKGSLRMGPGTLYESIQRLLEAGAPGLHFYTLNRSKATREIFSALRLPV